METAKFTYVKIDELWWQLVILQILASSATIICPCFKDSLEKDI